MASRCILLVQLPIPPVGPGPIRGNVPLAAGYLKLFAWNAGLEADYAIEILPPPLANSLGDRGLVAEIVARRPWMVGFTVYLWNVERTLWLAAQIKRERPETLILIGGPEVTADNSWVLDQPTIDFAAIGEGERTFAELLAALSAGPVPPGAIDGLFVADRRARDQRDIPIRALPKVRAPLSNLDEISSPYLAGILDAADEQMLLLETVRGCVFKCKFCYYPKSYDGLYFAGREKIAANLAHARERGARELVLLDPTLNQRKDFADLLRLIAEYNADGQFACFGELRAEGIDRETARLLRAANFTEVEIGLQSVDPLAQRLMDRRNNLKAYERGIAALLEQGIKVKVDLIVGLPGDTDDSIRRGFRYVRESGLFSEVQVFQLAVLPGTSFRQEADSLGLAFQPRPPYYVTRTPTLELDAMVELMQEAQDLFEIEFDPLPTPDLNRPAESLPATGAIVDLDDESWQSPLPPANDRKQAFTLWLRCVGFSARRAQAASVVREVLADNPFTTLQLVLEPTGDPRALDAATLEAMTRACFERPTYLDRFYAFLPGRPIGAKRLVVALEPAEISAADPDWLTLVDEYATLVPYGAGATVTNTGSLE